MTRAKDSLDNDFQICKVQGVYQEIIDRMRASIAAEQKEAIKAILTLGKDALKTARGIESSDALLLHNKSSKIKLLNDRDIEIFNLGFYSGLDAGQYTLDRLLSESGASQEE